MKHQKYLKNLQMFPTVVFMGPFVIWMGTAEIGIKLYLVIEIFYNIKRMHYFLDP